MKQMNIDENLVVNIDYTDSALSAIVRQFKPVLFKDGELICCLLGPDRDQGIFGCGSTEDEAIKNWEDAFRERFESNNEEDEVAAYIKDTLAISKKDVW